MLSSLRLRLTIGAMIAIGLSLFMVWFALSRLFTEYVTNQYMQEMQVVSDSLTAGISIKDGIAVLDREPSDPRYTLPGGGLYWQINVGGQKSLRSRSLWDHEVDVKTLMPSGFGQFMVSDGPAGSPILLYQQSSQIEDGDKAVNFTVMTGFERAEFGNALATFHDELRRMLFATAMLLMVAALLQGAIGLSPLARLKAGIANIRSGASQHIDENVPGEVLPLVKEINMLITERETALERARARASDLAHGLKTPLTVLSNLAESLPPEERDTALKQVELIRQRSDRQLQAARMGVEQMATTEVSGLVNKLVQVIRPMTLPRDIAWSVDIPAGLTIGIDPADLAEATGNVLDNAGKWAASRIRVAARKIGDIVNIEVADDGPGIPEAETANVLLRGHSLDEAAGGHGLGLAISQDIVTAYGGSISIGRSDLGGALLTLCFPERPVMSKVSVPH